MKYAKPTSGGAIGVVLVWTEWPKANGKSVPPSFVIKPVQGSAAPTKVAELILSKVAGALSPHSKGVRHSSHNSRGPGKWIEDTLLRFRQAETNLDIIQRWGQVWPHYRMAESYLIQEFLPNKDFGEEYRSSFGLSCLLLDGTLMENLGKLFVADAMIGNGDRLCQPNASNILFTRDGKLCAIDSATILTNFNAALQDVSRSAWVADNPDELTPGIWAKGVVKDGTNAVASPAQQKEYDRGKAPVVPPSFQMEVLFNPAQWWEKVFKGHLKKGLGDPDPTDPNWPSEHEWEQGKKAFLRGVQLGEKELDRRLSGLNWLMVKLRYKKYVSRYGGDPNLDWTNLEIRRAYFKLRRKGLSAEQAMQRVQDQARRKLRA